MPPSSQPSSRPTKTSSKSTSNTTVSASKPLSTSERTTTKPTSAHLTLSSSLLPILPIPLGLPLPTGVTTATALGTETAIRRGRDQTKKARARTALQALVINLVSPEGVKDEETRSELRDARAALRRGGGRKVWVVPASERDNASGRKDEQGLDNGSAAGVHHIRAAFRAREHDEALWKEEGYNDGGTGCVCTIPLPQHYTYGADSHTKPKLGSRRGETGEREDEEEEEGEQQVLLNWLYVDRETCEIKCGTRSESEGAGHIMGPWSTSSPLSSSSAGESEGNVTFQDWEGFLVVRERWEDEHADQSGWGWALYFDVEDDGLSSSGRVGAKVGGWEIPRILEVEVERREVGGGVSRGEVDERALWGLEKDGWGVEGRVRRTGEEASSQRGWVETTRERRGSDGVWRREKAGGDAGKEPDFEYGHLEVREEVDD